MRVQIFARGFVLKLFFLSLCELYRSRSSQQRTRGTLSRVMCRVAVNNTCISFLSFLFTVFCKLWSTFCFVCFWVTVGPTCHAAAWVDVEV